MCRRYGAIWAYYQRKSVAVICGNGALEKYGWRNRTLEFYRCKTCGCVTHHERSKKRADKTDTRAVNIRNIAFRPADNFHYEFVGAHNWFKVTGRSIWLLEL